MQQASARVRTFFDQYESSVAGSDATATAAQYGESFIFAGPQGNQAVRREDLVKVLPKRQDFFKSLGLRSSRVIGLEEASVDERCVLVKVQWRMQLGSDATAVSELDVFAISGPMLARHVMMTRYVAPSARVVWIVASK